MRIQLVLGALAAFILGAAVPTSAIPDQSAFVVISEDDGFPGVCAAPCYEVEKTADVYNPGNPDPVVAAAGCGAGDFTYIYTLTHIGGTLPSPNIPITQFEVTVDDLLVSSAGSIVGGGIAPTGAPIVSTLDVVTWNFPLSTACPTCLDEGNTSDQLFICSPAASGSSPDNVSTTAIILDAPGECLVPTQLAPPGEPSPCTIGFWKNRANGKKGVLKFFPNTDFDDVVAAALALSGGVFTTADVSQAGCPNFDDLICALTSKGNRTTEERARQQLAATLLNLAAGDLFPANGKCVLFEANTITSNACGDNLSVGTAVGTSKTGITSGDSAQEHDALECLDDINNEIGVVQ